MLRASKMADPGHELGFHLLSTRQSKSAERQTLCPSKLTRYARKHIRPLDEPVTMMHAWKGVFDMVENGAHRACR